MEDEKDSDTMGNNSTVERKSDWMTNKMPTEVTNNPYLTQAALRISAEVDSLSSIVWMTFERIKLTTPDNK